MNFEKTYAEYYMPLLKAYAENVTAQMAPKAFAGIPQPFIPAWGKNYWRSPVRMAFVGLETNGWGDLSTWLQSVKDEKWEHAFDVAAFQNLDYIGWTKGHRYTFWGFIMFFLAALTGVKNWEVLKWKQRPELLDDFVWGNATSIQCAKSIKPPFDSKAWQVAKTESATLDDFLHLKTLFDPKVVVMMCSKEAAQRYLRNADDRKLLLNHGGYVQLFDVGGTLVFRMPHPSNMKFNMRADYYAKILCDELQNRHLFVPLKAFANYDADAEKLLKDLVKEAVAEKNLGPHKNKEVIIRIAAMLKKQNASISVSMLARILNEAGCRTSYGARYSGGRGTYKLVKTTWQYCQNGLKCPDLADQVALAFRKPDGQYAYE